MAAPVNSDDVYAMDLTTYSKNWEDNYRSYKPVKPSLLMEGEDEPVRFEWPKPLDYNNVDFMQTQKRSTIIHDYETQKPLVRPVVLPHSGKLYHRYAHDNDSVSLAPITTTSVFGAAVAIGVSILL
ncbi:hypothetical protein TRVA0_052S00320 [Trichomonascus vanleenenianus]|uniref:uncharacterized protein n=1 Tax=Trichomonascus vanleenenianus TaxID=2268995 RepID=UPI003ECA9CD7